MPSIPYPSQPRAPQLEQPGVRLDAGALSAGARGAQAFGAGLQDAAGVIVSHAIQVQQHVNEGILANEDTIRRNVAAEIENNITSNEGDISSWERFARDKKAEYESNRQLRAQDEQWDSEVTRVDELNSKEFFARQEVALGATVTKAQVAKSNARLQVNAQLDMALGKEDAAKEKIARMNLSEPERYKVQENIVKNGWKDIVNSDILTDAPEVVKNINAKDESGRFTHYGSLDATQRKFLSFNAQKAMNEGQSSLRTEIGNAAVDELQTGGGRIDEQTEAMYRMRADHWGVPQKTVDNLLKVPKQADNSPQAFAEAYAAANRLDPASPTFTEDWATIGKRSAGFSGVNKEIMDTMLKDKINPKDPVNSAPSKFGVTIIDAYYARQRKESSDPDAKQPTEAEQTAYTKAQGEALAAFHHWYEENPKADEAMVGKWWGDRQAKQESDRGVKSFSPNPTAAPDIPAYLMDEKGELTKNPAYVAVSPEDAKKLKPGTRFLGTDGKWRIRQ